MIAFDVGTICRLRSGNCRIKTLNAVGVVCEIHTHQCNGRTMYRVEFTNALHQSYFQHTFFYGDDLEGLPQ